MVHERWRLGCPWSLTLLASLAGDVGLAQRTMPTKLIMDTDMTTDVDDVVALCVAHKLQDNGDAEIVGVMHNTGLEQGVGVVSVINHFYGRDNIPIGAFKGDFNNPKGSMDRWVLDYSAGPYVFPLIKEFDAPIKSSTQVPEAVEVYRKVLAEQPDHSVVIASLGFLGNLAKLLESGPDDHSILCGKDLVALKVRELVVTGGRYPNSNLMHYEWNFGGGCVWGSPSCPHTPRWTKTVVDGWPDTVPITFSGFELGAGVLTGGRMEQCAPEWNPCRQALELYKKADQNCPPRPSWDSITTLYAANGVERWGERHQGGYNLINGTDGANEWVDGPPTHQSYLALQLGKADALGNEIDELLCTDPAFAV